MSGGQLRIGELAKALGTTTKTLRFYERIGLLPPPERSTAGYRLYSDEIIVQARLVLGLRRIGLTIDEVGEVLNSHEGLSMRQRLASLMDEKLRNIDLDLSVLQGRREDLAARHLALLSTPRYRPPDCICEALPTACTCESCHCAETEKQSA